MNNITETTLNSHTYFTEIKKVTLKEKKIFDFEVKFKKGDLIKTKRRLFGKPILQYAKTDLYEESNYYDKLVLVDAETKAKYRCVSYNPLTKEFYRKAKVIITFRNDKTEEHLFDETKDAVGFLETIKEKCSQCGNRLL